jgi:sugar phosphate permease
MTSIFPIAYGMSKFVSGVLGAKISPAKLLACGLIATAVINVAFGFGASLTWFCFFWAMNGVLQVGWLPTTDRLPYLPGLVCE